MATLPQDLRYSLRTLRKSPGFAAAAIGILALGIGANTAIFSVVDAVLLRPMPFAAPGRLMRVMHVPPAASFPGLKTFSVSPANYLEWQAQNHVFTAMAAYGGAALFYGVSATDPALFGAVALLLAPGGRRGCRRARRCGSSVGANPLPAQGRHRGSAPTCPAAAFTYFAYFLGATVRGGAA